MDVLMSITLKMLGLSRYINALNPLFHIKYSRRMSRADFYALASVVALEKATEKVADKFLGRSQLTFGRKDCSTVPEEDSENRLPSALGNIDDTYLILPGNSVLVPKKQLLCLECIH